ncbi:unnamed protein product, partial [Choristocarpus tenellus]
MKLRDYVLKYGDMAWVKVANALLEDHGQFTGKECEERWNFVQENHVRGPWSSEEDDHLRELVAHFGAKKWNFLAREFPGRTGKQCRERWHNHVDERVNKTEWTKAEDQMLCDYQQLMGNKWSEMSRIFNGRSENSIKNRFNSLCARGMASRTSRPSDLLQNTIASCSDLKSKVGAGAMAPRHDQDLNKSNNRPSKGPHTRAPKQPNITTVSSSSRKVASEGKGGAVGWARGSRVSCSGWEGGS